VSRLALGAVLFASAAYALDGPAPFPTTSDGITGWTPSDAGTSRPLEPDGGANTREADGGIVQPDVHTLETPSPSVDHPALFTNPTVQYQAERDALNGQGIYLVGQAIECGPPDPKDTLRPDCPPQGQQLTDIGWWFSRAKVLALAEKLQSQQNQIAALQARTPIQVPSLASFTSGAKWFTAGLVLGGAIVAGSALAYSLKQKAP